MNYNFLLSIAIILLSTKFLSRVSQKVNMPQVVGALLAGLILGPSVLGLITETDFLMKSSEIGVIILMFIAGLDTDIKEIKNNSVSYVVMASCGVLIPLIGGFVAYYFFFDVDASNSNELLKALFIGVVLTATSVSITVEALREMGKLNGKVGNAILGAAVIDDIMGIIILTLVTSMKDPSVEFSQVIIKILLYCVAMVILSRIIKISKKYLDELEDKRRICIYIFAFCLIIAFISEHFFGIADITGAYLFGLFLSGHSIKHFIAKKMTVASYLFFSPIFFASIGIKTQLSGMTVQLFIFSLILLAVAILTKIVGCGIGARLCHYTKKEALQIGVGMVSRGEVALIVAQKGYGLGLISGALFPPVVLMVIVTTIVTPVILKQLMK